MYAREDRAVPNTLGTGDAAGPQSLIDPPAAGRAGGASPISFASRAESSQQTMRNRVYTVVYGWRSANEAPEHRAHLPAMADPRAHPRLPSLRRVGAADAGRSGRLPAAGAPDRLGRSVGRRLPR